MIEIKLSKCDSDDYKIKYNQPKCVVNDRTFYMNFELVLSKSQMIELYDKIYMELEKWV
jgi:hypothetical protein